MWLWIPTDLEARASKYRPIFYWIGWILINNMLGMNLISVTFWSYSLLMDVWRANLKFRQKKVQKTRCSLTYMMNIIVRIIMEKHAFWLTCYGLTILFIQSPDRQDEY